MLATVFWILASLTSSCYAADFSDVYRELQALAETDFAGADLPIPGPVPLSQGPELGLQGRAPRELDIPPPAPRPTQLQRLIQPWGDGYVRMPVRRQLFNDTTHRRAGRLRRPSKPNYPSPSTNMSSVGVARRDEAVDAADKPSLFGWSHLDDYEGLAYMIEIDIGTPPQKVAVAIDTGSYELWVNPKCLGSPDPKLCGTYGHYYPQHSNTSYNVGANFKIVYGTGAAAGTYYQDTMKVALWQMPLVQFAVASDSNYTYSGVLGLGYGYPFTTKYPTLIGLMWTYGFIAAPLIAVGLGGEGEGFSEIIFGGVNRWKFTGPLEPVPIWPPIDKQDPSWIQYWVNLTSIGHTHPTKGPDVYVDPAKFVMPMLIDTGSTLSYIREDIVQVVGKALNATVDSKNTYWVDCNLRKQNGTIDFGFKRGKVVITVSYKDFIWQQYPGRCMMGFQPADAGTTSYVLGDTFIRGAYLVFDQQVDVVWMADYYNCGDGVAIVGQKPLDTQYVIGQC